MSTLRPLIEPLLGLRPWRQHSVVLAVGGAAYFLIGLSYLLTPMNPARQDGLTLPLRLAEMPAWSLVWMIFGGLAFASTRWPPTSERWGYVAMSSLSALWAAFFALGIPLGSSSSNIFSVLVWALFSFLWWAVSGLRNPEDLVQSEVPTTEGA